MRKVISILCLLSLLIACKTKNVSTGDLKTDKTEKLLTRQWVIKNFTVPVALQSDTSLYKVLEEAKEKSILIFNNNHTFSFTLPGNMGEEKGTWEVKPDGKIAVTDTKNKVTEFSAEMLYKKEFNFEILSNDAKGTGVFLYFVPKLK